MTINGRAIRVIIIALSSVLFAGLLFTVLRTPSIDLITSMISDRALVFKNTNLVGWKEGRKQWEIEASEIWTTRNQSTTTFEDVKSGTIYKRGRSVVKGLLAHRVVYNNWSKDIEIVGKDPEDNTRKLYALVDIENLTSEEAPFKKPRFVSFQADHVIYQQNSRVALAEGNIKITEKRMLLRGEKMEIKGNSRKATMAGGVRMTKGGTRISGDSLAADFGADTYIINGNVKMAQKDKSAIGDEARIDNFTGSLEIIGNVKFLIDKASALVKGASALKYQETKESLAEKTIIECDKLTLHDKSKNAVAEGSVLIIQKGKRAKSDHAFYNGLDESIILTGNVFIEKEKDWLKTEKVLVSVSRESFEAVGRVEAEFKIKK